MMAEPMDHLANDQGLHLLCRVGGSRLAFPAHQIEAVVRCGALVPAPGAPPCVRGLAAIRSRLLTVLDCAVIAGEHPGDSPFMAIITVDGHGYGLLLDAVDDVVLLPPSQAMPVQPKSGWQALHPQLIDHCGEMWLAVEPAQFVSLSVRPATRAA